MSYPEHLAVPRLREDESSRPSPSDRAEAMLLNESSRLRGVHYLIFAFAWMGWLFDFYNLFLYTFLLRHISPELGLTRERAGFALGASLAATAVGGLFFGVLADRIGRRPVLIGTILTFSLGTALTGFSHGFGTLVLCQIIAGLGVGGEWATGHAIVAESFPARLRGRAGSLLQTGAPVGLAAAAAVGGFLEPEIGWRNCFLVSIVPALLLAVAMASLMPESDMWLSRRRDPGHAPAGDAMARTEGISSLVTGHYRYLFFLALMLAMFDLSAYWFTYSWLPEYLQGERGLAQARSSIWILVMQIGGFIGYATFGIVADFLGRRPAYTIYGIIWAVGLIMMTLLWHAIGGASSVIVTCMFLVGIGTGMFGGYGPLFAEIFPTSIRNTAMGAAFNLARGVQFFTPVIIAIIARHWGLAGGISFAAFFAVLTGLWVWLFPETKGRRLQELEGSLQGA